MDQEQNQMQSAPQLCRNGCGFYGSPSFDGLCSKCHKDVAKSQAEQASKEQGGGAADLNTALLAATTAQPTVPVLPPGPAPSAAETAAEPEACSSADDQEQSASSGAESAAASPADPAAKKKRSRCQVCKKKVGLTGFTCRCEGLFCSLHRYSDKHGCNFDYRVHGQQQIRKNNPVIVGEKVNKI